MKIAILGGRGIPANYSGFDTLIEEIGGRLAAEPGFEVTVYCRRRYYESRPPRVRGVRCVYLPALPGKGIESISHTTFSVLHLLPRACDLAFVVDPANAPFALPLAAKRIPVVFHTDGLGWMRSKWGGLSRRYYKWVEGLCARTATALVTDSRAMQQYYLREWDAPSAFIPYGAVTTGGADDSALTRLGLAPGGYWLVVTRIEPENNTDLIVREYLASGSALPLVVVGGARYASAYSQQLFAQASERVRFVGPIYAPAALNGLYAQALCYLHGHEVGGTNPGLLRAMHAGAPCLAVDIGFNREVLDQAGRYFAKTAGSLAGLLREVECDPGDRTARGRAGQERASRLYRWDAVASAYAELFRRLGTGGRDRTAAATALAREVYRPEVFGP